MERDTAQTFLILMERIEFLEKQMEMHLKAIELITQNFEKARKEGKI